MSDHRRTKELVSYPDPSAILYRARRKGSGNIGIYTVSVYTSARIREHPIRSQNAIVTQSNA